MPNFKIQNFSKCPQGRFGIFPWIFAGAVSSGDMAHGFTGFCEKLKIFGSAFFGAGLRSVGAFDYGVCGDEA
jgi:hypothetical protein